MTTPALRRLTLLAPALLLAAAPLAAADAVVTPNENHEFTQLYRYDHGSGAVTLLTDGRSQNGGVAWSRAGERIAYGSTRRNGKDRDVRVMDPRDPASDRSLLELEGGGWRALDWSPDGSRLLLGELVSANESYLWIVDVASGARTPLTPRGGADKVAYPGGQFSADGKGVYTVTDRGFEFQRLARLEVASGEHRYLSSDVPWDVEDFELSHDGRTLAFVANERGTSVLRLLDVATGRWREPALPPGVIGTIKWRPDDGELAFSLANARSATDVYTLDAASGSVERWTESEAGGLDAAAFSEPELVEWKSFDGRAISGFLYKPPARFAGPRPVIVNIHGGPEGQARPGFQGRNNYYLNELGVAILFPNVRGSSGFGKTFLTLEDEGHGFAKKKNQDFQFYASVLFVQEHLLGE